MPARIGASGGPAASLTAAPIYLLVLITLIVQGCHVGSRVVATLFAIELGANPFFIGALILVPVATVARKARLDLPPQPSREERRSTLDLWRVPALRRAVIVSGLMTTGWDLYTFYVPIYGNSIGLAPSTIGNVLGMFAAAVLFLPFPLVEFVPLLYALSFAIGFALGCGQPLTLTLAYNSAPPGHSGEVTGLRLTVNNVTHIGVPGRGRRAGHRAWRRSRILGERGDTRCDRMALAPLTPGDE